MEPKRKVRMAGLGHRLSATLLPALLLVGCDVYHDPPAPPSEDPAKPELASADALDLGLSAATSSPAYSQRKIQVACGSDEETIFSCKTDAGKTIAVCASEKSVQYRYGKDTAAIVLTATEWASVPYSGGGEGQIRFTNGDTDYIVFSRMIRTHFKEGEPNYPAISDGVIVMRDDEVLRLLECEGGQAEKPLDFNIADARLARLNELFTEETGRAD